MSNGARGTRVHDKSTATTVIKSRSSPTEHGHVLYAGPLAGQCSYPFSGNAAYQPPTHIHPQCAIKHSWGYFPISCQYRCRDGCISEDALPELTIVNNNRLGTSTALYGTGICAFDVYLHDGSMVPSHYNNTSNQVARATTCVRRFVCGWWHE